MVLKKLAIVGRPNVGKSAIFNRICKKRISIVDEMEGVTRDRIYAQADIFGYPFELIDSGGIDFRGSDAFRKEIVEQTKVAIEEADALVMIVDATVGLLDLDREVALELLKTDKPVVLAVNKVDNANMESLLHQFHPLGIPNIFAVSATQGTGLADLLECAMERFKDELPPEEEETTIRLSIVGKPNTGKSTLLNSLLDETRSLVSPIAGTTRDSLDVPFEHMGQQFVLIDTAGIRHKNAEKDVVEKFAAIRTKEAIDRSQICLLILDATKGLTTHDKRIARMIEKEGKGCIILLNKWDLVKGYRMESCLKVIRQESPFLSHCPILFISAKTGRNLSLIIPEVQKVHEALTKRLSTHQLNTFVEKAIQLNHPPMLNGKRLRVYYLTQVGSEPPVFVLFVNNKDLMTATYKRYLVNQFRVHHNFLGTPLQLILRGKKKSDNPFVT
ncbi:MAG: GTPase Der [Chlamydiales bacterium]|nr:GTPase Der [Chlamydiales bacterium]MCH9636258.1 GTPase Der [Chlamydiales bacterium]MCH9703310.1 ribosome biogenesis GTPase Der [Chlamydiota bacterium]